MVNDPEKRIQQRTNWRLENMMQKKKHRTQMIASAALEEGGGFGGCTVLLALFQTLQSGTVQWSYTDITHVNNMNKTDVIKTGSTPSPPPFCCFSALWWERSTTEGKQCCSSLTHSPTLSFALWLSFPLSSFHPSSLHSVSPWGCKAWLSTEAELSKLGGSAKEKSKRLVCAFVWVCVCECKAQLSHFSLLGNMKLDKQQNYASPYSRDSYTGRNKTDDRDTEEQIKSKREPKTRCWRLGCWNLCGRAVWKNRCVILCLRTNTWKNLCSATELHYIRLYS